MLVRSSDPFQQKLKEAERAVKEGIWNDVEKANDNFVYKSKFKVREELKES